MRHICITLWPLTQFLIIVKFWYHHGYLDIENFQSKNRLLVIYYLLMQKILCNLMMCSQNVPLKDVGKLLKDLLTLHCMEGFFEERGLWEGSIFKRLTFNHIIIHDLVQILINQKILRRSSKFSSESVSPDLTCKWLVLKCQPLYSGRNSYV